MPIALWIFAHVRHVVYGKQAFQQLAAPGREPEISGIPKLHSGRTRYRLLGFPADWIKPCYAWIGWAYPRVRHGTTQWLELVGLASQLQKSWVSRSGIAALPERMICPSPLDRSRALRPSAAPAQHAARAGSGRSRYRGPGTGARAGCARRGYEQPDCGR